jgi:hypothetical protein
VLALSDFIPGVEVCERYVRFSAYLSYLSLEYTDGGWSLVPKTTTTIGPILSRYRYRNDGSIKKNVLFVITENKLAHTPPIWPEINQ